MFSIKNTDDRFLRKKYDKPTSYKADKKTVIFAVFLCKSIRFCFMRKIAWNKGFFMLKY